jgi:L-xylulokinase
MQIKADVIGMSVEKPVVTEAAVLGAAMLAAVGNGEFKSLSESSQALYRVDGVLEPNMENTGKYQSSYEKYLQLKARLYGETGTR